MRSVLKLAVAVVVRTGWQGLAQAGRNSPAPDYAAAQAAIAAPLQSPQRLPLPLERIRP